ncbi:hypothetical protein ACH4KO_09905 [Streptomyces anulatus]
MSRHGPNVLRTSRTAPDTRGRDPFVRRTIAALLRNREYPPSEPFPGGHRLPRTVYGQTSRRKLLGRPPEELHLVIAHLGGGCSACAVRDGVSVDTTMGFTPLDGLMMSHRGGSVDPGALTWLQTRHRLSASEIENALNHESGLLALSGTSDDTRDLVHDRAAGGDRAALALDVFTHHCRKGVAAMAASLDRLDAPVFTGDIGEDQPEVREEV